MAQFVHNSLGKLSNSAIFLMTPYYFCLEVHKYSQFFFPPPCMLLQVEDKGSRKSHVHFYLQWLEGF